MIIDVKHVGKYGCCSLNPKLFWHNGFNVTNGNDQIEWLDPKWLISVEFCDFDDLHLVFTLFSITKSWGNPCLNVGGGICLTDVSWLFLPVFSCVRISQRNQTMAVRLEVRSSVMNTLRCPTFILLLLYQDLTFCPIYILIYIYISYTRHGLLFYLRGD